jgi:endonuclease-3
MIHLGKITMIQDQYHFEEIFKHLDEELKKYKRPILSQKKWDNVVQNPFTTLISCILSLRTKDEVTEQASIRLLEKNDTPEKILKLPLNQIEDLIFPVGFYKVKAKRIKEISKSLKDEYDGEVPDDFDELMKLKGVGRKTANIVMVYGHKKEGFIPVDVHCHRIPNRLGWISTKNPEETEYELKKILPKEYWNDFNNLFVKFGQTICVPTSPFCSKCSIYKYCKRINVKKFR